jgi:hypothetical protein
VKDVERMEQNAFQRVHREKEMLEELLKDILKIVIEIEVAICTDDGLIILIMLLIM